MFTPRDLVARFKTQPFEPFQILMSNGVKYDVVHPDQGVVARGHIALGLPPESGENGSYYETTIQVSILHITELRPLRRKARPRRA